MTELRVRDVTEADLPAILRIRARSFGPLPDGGDRWWRRVADETLGGRMLAVVDGDDRVLASGRARPFEQVWGGRHQPMGGVAGVYVDPVARGRGVASLLMRGLLARMAELGDAISCLFPTAPGLYRGVGYEFGGPLPRFTYAAQDLRGLRSLSGGLRPRPAGPDDAELLHALMRTEQERGRVSGPRLPGPESWRVQLADDETIANVHDGRGSGPRGFVTYSLADETLKVDDLVADNGEAAAALWSVVGSGSSAAPTVQAHLDPRDPVALIAGAEAKHDVEQHLWMLRIIDLPRAVAARGFSPALATTVHLAVDDPDLPANSGTWRLEVSGGSARATPVERPLPAEGPLSVEGPVAVDRPPARLGPRGLAALWCGWPMPRLRQAGLVTGGNPEDDCALDAVFSGAPYMTEYF
ncbi:MAG: GNAT family N-acetyltransferase [Intrasporangium sp.]|uniref:GNAT family N-acetyltransferase n=1 Tax=Intrasporangium sp. TaxID=1925024 RepID=UPI003F7E267A